MKRPLFLVFSLLTGLLFLLGIYLALVWAPPERDMGEVYRVIFVHVPNAWVCLVVAAPINFFASIFYLMRESPRADALAEASGELTMVLGIVVLVTGSIWARPTWGVWWTNDPRLITFAIMVVMYAGYLALRASVDDPERRATWSAVVGILDGVLIPIVWYSVKFWNSIHQMQSSPEQMAPNMARTLSLNALAYTALFALVLFARYRLARLRSQKAWAPPPLKEQK